MQAPTGLMTVDEWLLYDVPEGFGAELVDGMLEMTPLAGKRHQRVLAKLIDVVIGLRVDEEAEQRGLDLSQHAETAYNLV